SGRRRHAAPYPSASGSRRRRPRPDEDARQTGQGGTGSWFQDKHAPSRFQGIPMRPSERTPEQLRTVTLETGVNRYAEGSCLVSFGHTKVLVTASIEEKVPGWMRNTGQGWVTAEYGMLPRATHTRGRREAAAGKQS